MPATLSLSRLWGQLDSRLDRVAIGISGLCLAHCVATTVLLALISSAGGLLDPRIHEIGLMLAILFGIVALGRGIVSHGYILPAAVGAFGLGIMAGALTLPHGDFEIMWTLIGVSFVALGHDLNRRATY
ncbi:MerC domain-containing protein [Sphingomonas canadensis]|uniref:MerC domain-containing protein n=1 Tax=Sphingomonas canadensis TaxID=1219257 RepID=A0ABW3H7N1_9SPHN|nr:MerC domain-containing protein [Sphingomonas canadensis]MCW3837031.1 MerC domain-containing protein [Sphingomonas canadensis]